MPYIRILVPRQPSPWHSWGDVDTKCFGQAHVGWRRVWLLDTEVTECCSLARGLPARLAKATSAAVSLNCCRQSTRYYGTLREGRVNKAAEGRRPGFRVKHPMLQNSENNQLDRFQKQTSLVPLQCLLESCYADMSLLKNNPADL